MKNMLSRKYYISLRGSRPLFKPHFKMYEMQEQTTNLNGDDFCVLRCFDSIEAISHITWDNQENMTCCAVGLSGVSFFFFEEVKLKEINHKGLLGRVNMWSIKSYDDHPLLPLEIDREILRLSVLKPALGAHLFQCCDILCSLGTLPTQSFKLSWKMV